MSTTDNERKGNRLSKIVTRTGDAGTTGLGDGSRTTKDSLRIDAMGEVDELNSSLGVLLCEELPDTVRAALLDVQNDLFDLGGELCLPGMEVVKDVQVARLEALAEELNADLPMLKEFILPGGTRPAALAHLSRTVCRRAERSMVRLNSRRASLRRRPPLHQPPLRSAVHSRPRPQPRRRPRRRAVAKGQDRCLKPRRPFRRLPLPPGRRQRLS